jgi:putative component of membrane protein insertase Oxa1/YidC/SpoIIIJ protein YidD
MEILPDFPKEYRTFGKGDLPKCRYGQNCNNYSEDHRKSFRHIKIKCKYGPNCRNYTTVHRKSYIH